MRRIGVAVALTSVLVSASVSESNEVARAGVETEVSMVLAYQVDAQLREYRVEVDAGKQKCVPDRKVSVFQKLPGEDDLIGKKTTGKRGHATVREEPAPPYGDGEFYAKVKRREVGDTVCKAGKSAVGAGARATSSAAAFN